METEEKKIYTIEDIARELGVSKTTVSRAISGKRRISQATRDRVRAFIKEHDYRPNVVAKGLAQRKTYNIALLSLGINSDAVLIISLVSLKELSTIHTNGYIITQAKQKVKI